MAAEPASGVAPPPTAELARVLALLDASRHSLAALAAAVDLARRRHAELVALYVEDSELLRCAAFPFACEIGAQSGLARPLSSARLTAGSARQQAQIRQALARAVAGRELRHRLEISRGPVVSEALARIGPQDVLVLGKAGLTERLGARLGSTSRRLLLDAPGPVLVWNAAPGSQRGPLFQVDADPPTEGTPHLPEWLAALFDGITPLSLRHAEALAARLRHCRHGGLLLRRAHLARLLEEDPQLLMRVALPVVVIP